MLQPAVPIHEPKRLTSLRETHLLHSAPEAEFDNITKLAAYVCKCPVALISLISEDKQWFKSKVGTDLCDAAREISICAHTILEPRQLTEIPDLRLDERFDETPLMKCGEDPILFYAGIPILDRNGFALGTLCVMDIKPRDLDEEQREALKSLGKQVETLFELHRKNFYLQKVKRKLAVHNKLLKNYAGVVSHDIKMPLASMILTTDILKAKFAKKLGPEGINYLRYLKQSSLHLSEYVNGILDHYESDSLAASATEEFDLHQLLEDIIDLLNITEDCEINLPEKNEILCTNRSALEQILLNLLGNSLKYNDKERIVINLDFHSDAKFYHFKISDNGMGIPREQQGEVFKLFKTLKVVDRKGNRGKGIGLSTVKKLVKSLGGRIRVKSVLHEGTSFIFNIKRNL